MEELLNKFEDQQKEIDALKARVTILEGFEEWTESTVQKLPLWGNQDVDVTFEWPTEEDWANMDPNLSITSIDFGL